LSIFQKIRKEELKVKMRGYAQKIFELEGEGKNENLLLFLEKFEEEGIQRLGLIRDFTKNRCIDLTFRNQNSNQS